MDVAILKCRAGSQFHFGLIAHDENMGLDATSDRLHSDTLFSALVNLYDKVWNNDEKLNTDEFVKAFSTEQIKVSSTSYCLEYNGNFIYFYPKPIHATLLVDEEFKRIKRIKFVSKGILEKGIRPAEWSGNNCVIMQDKFVCTKKELDDMNISISQDKYDYTDIKLFEMHDETKVKVHASNPEGRLYNQTNLMIADNADISKELKVHFWFAYELKNKDDLYAKRFMQIMNMLQHTGIGGQRSTGSGFVEGVKFENFSYTNPANSNFYLSLSILKPRNESEFTELIYHDVVMKGGRTIRQYLQKGDDDATQLKLKRTRMIAEGAVCKSKITGSIAEITPNGEENKYLRYGVGMFIALHPNFEPDKTAEL